MNARDYNGRFERTLAANKLEFTVTIESSECAGIKIEHKNYRIKPRCSFDGDVLVHLTRVTRPTRLNRVARSSHKIFAVSSYASKKARVVRGMRNVWLEIKIACLPL